MKTKDEPNAGFKSKLLTAALVCVLVAGVSTAWEFQVGDTLYCWSGLSYLPSYSVGPYDRWEVTSDRQGPCNGFSSSRFFGFVAGRWQVYFEVIRGWRKPSSDSHDAA